MVEEIRARDNDTSISTSTAKRRNSHADWLHKTLTSSPVSSFMPKPRPDIPRHASLPTIMTHGVLSQGDRVSVATSVSEGSRHPQVGQPPPLSPPPKAALGAMPSGDASWPALASARRPRTDRAWPSDLSVRVGCFSSLQRALQIFSALRLTLGCVQTIAVPNAQVKKDEDEVSIRSCARTIAEVEEKGDGRLLC